jgi:hypothetical protein
VLPLACCGVLLALHPTTSYRSPILHPLGDFHAPTALCPNPFNRLAGAPQFAHENTSSGHELWMVASAACSAAADDREHIINAPGIGAVLLVGLSFLPRRRALATERQLEPSTGVALKAQRRA